MDTLQRLIEAERRAEQIADEANRERDEAIQQAIRETRLSERHFDQRVPEIHAGYVRKAEERATQIIAEMERRAAEYHRELEQRTKAGRDMALRAALAVILDPDRA
jgi:hypothetical protein